MKTKKETNSLRLFRVERKNSFDKQTSTTIDCSHVVQCISNGARFPTANHKRFTCCKQDHRLMTKYIHAACFVIVAYRFYCFL